MNYIQFYDDFIMLGQFKLSFILLILIMTTQTMNIFKFSADASMRRWQTINDGVMGGLSKSSLSISDSGYGQFSGHVSLANNGGFASVRLLTDVKVNPKTQQIILKIKGDGKNYQFRLKSENEQNHSYIKEFKTTGEWQTVELDLKDFSPQYRGQQLDLPNFNFSTIKETRFLIANKKEEEFKLLIDSINLEEK